ncbi:hypothetical protein C8R46DRAFT_1239983 [Mycena filopes]|nr:hypothetical protein C8R46DRAFT_1239983 [Mycena filopes]
MAICAFCQGTFASTALVRRHQLQNAICKERFTARVGANPQNLTSRHRRARRALELAGEEAPAADLPSAEELAAILDEIPFENQEEPPEDPVEPEPDQDAALPAEPPLARAGPRPQWFRPVDPKLGAGATYGTAKTTFELIEDAEF